MIRRLACAIATMMLLSSPALAQTREPARVILVGDSTMQAGGGYGAVLCTRFTAQVTCLNRGRGGRSSKSYRAEGAWDETLAIAKDGTFKKTYIFIQMGHNDGSERPERHTELTEYKANMARFVDEARTAGATPVLITPVTDRRFKDGRLLPGMKPWADLTAQVAREKAVVLIDLYASSYQAVQAMGALQSAWLAPGAPPPSVLEGAKTGDTPGGLAPPPEPAPAPGSVTAAPAVPPSGPPRTGPFDYVHIGPTAAPIFAGMVADGIKTQMFDLSPYVVAAK